MLESVLVSTDTYPQLTLLGATPRLVGDPPAQEVLSSGHSVWQIHVASTDWRGRAASFTVTMGLSSNPTSCIPPLSFVCFEQLELGFYPPDPGQERPRIWYTASGIERGAAR